MAHQSDSHFLRAAGMPEGIFTTKRSSHYLGKVEKPRETTLIIENWTAEFLHKLNLSEPKRGRKCHGPFYMTSMAYQLESDEDILSIRKECPICLQKSPAVSDENIVAVTECEHIYCFECALRLIFLCSKTDCPICRHELTKVYLTREILDSTDDIRRFLIKSSQKRMKTFTSRVLYDDDSIYEPVKKLLWFQCNTCNIDFSLNMGICYKTQPNFDYVSRHL